MARGSRSQTRCWAIAAINAFNALASPPTIKPASASSFNTANNCFASPAKVIDPAAESTTVALNLTDIQQLRHQLDAIATDVVNYQCDVSIQVPRTEDYPWLNTLLSKRVKRIDSGYDLKIHRQILKHIPAQVVLIPRKAH